MTGVDDSRRLNGSAAFSFSAHAAVLGLYILMKLSEPAHKNLELREVEYFDLKPVPIQEAGPPAAQTPPQSLKDFLKMSLPSFKKMAQPQEAPQEAPQLPKEAFQEKMFDRKPLLVDKAAPLERNNNVKLDARLERTATTADLNDITRKTDNRVVPELSAMDAPKTISLEAVGRRAVAPSGPAIRIESSNGPARSGLRDMPTSSAPRGSPTGTAIAAPQGLDIKEDAPVRRGGGGMPSAPSFGYSRGGISLSEKTGKGPPAMALPAPAPVQAAKPQAELVQAKVSKNKGVEIAGPLAGRKIVSMVLPSYPDWARAKGIEAEVYIRFFVGPDGHVLDRLIVERTSGYKELDDVCMEALKKIVFVPLEGSTEEQWGVITFRFRLN